ncbi:unnamed protein product [Spirodela intermedia]|uniref:Uncharacterized protein n=1 Tax=Spirodela intermedia TaxID=51605 RepID=A0A7I8ICH3_SPIIN|nr:unnamed protein product [Spirodela intermedia]CAA6655321.1 unnamed protein product [Spirodela intermedia]
MAESVSHGTLINPCFFHLQKLELELKCPMCSCITSSVEGSLSCPICTLSLLPREMKRSTSKGHDFGEKIIEKKSQNGDVQNICRSKPCSTRDDVLPDQVRCSPPSSAGPKYSDDDSNDRGSVHGADCQINKTRFHGQKTDCTNRKSTSEIEEDQCREPKRLKLNSEPSCDITKTYLDEKSKGFGRQHVQQGVATFNLESEDQGIIRVTPSSEPKKFTSNPDFTCAFCHSSKESEASGPMLHYDNGEPVDTEHAARPHILHVHQKCIEWAPQAFFDGDNVMNWEAEISRASKIKCSSCGKKGAALGCYAKSCRKSFHVPCAVEIPGCRWDCDHFLVLCPSHSDRKLPIDKSNRRKSLKRLWMAPPEVTRGWVLCGSALSAAEKDTVAKFARLTGAVLSKDWRPSVTHVIASTDPFGACSRTLKFLMAILSGKWVLTIDWIKACLDARQPVAEASFEISHDIHGCFDGPRNGRIRILEQGPKLFSGLSFYFNGEFIPTYKGYLKDLIFAAGGHIVEEITEMPRSTGLVVYSLDPPQEGNSADTKGLIDVRLQEAKAVAARTGAEVIAHTWVLDSIAACKVQSLSH